MERAETTITPDLLILALDTSSRHGSLALLRGAEPLAIYGVETSETHSTRLIAEVDLLLTRAGVGLAGADGFAAVVGPGSFTGLRLGLATAKGLARAVGKPVVGVSALEATARTAGAAEAVLALVNAMRQEVYAQLFRITAGGEPIPLSQPLVAPASAVLERLADHPRLVLAGDGVRHYREAVEAAARARGYALHEAAIVGGWRAGWSLAPAAPFLALEAARLAAGRLARGEAQDPHRLGALYVRAADAELKLGQRRDKA